MEKIISKKKQTIERTHEIYCDGCKNYIGSSTEYDDGYYNEWGLYEIAFHITDCDWFYFSKCFCDNCKQKFIEKLKNTLLELGFTQEQH